MMYMVEIRNRGNFFKTFKDIDDANLYLLQNKYNNAILSELTEFNYDDCIYYDSFSLDHKIHAILNSEYRFLCKYNPNESTKQKALENYLSNNALSVLSF